MPFSPSTLDLLTALDTLSSHRLSCRDDLGMLLEAAMSSGQIAALEELSFQAKFAYRTYGMMLRIGKNGQGFPALQREFAGAVETVRALLDTLLEQVPHDAREQFGKRYLALAPDAMQHFLELCYDLSWYKNWQIDQRGTNVPPAPKHQGPGR